MALIGSGKTLIACLLLRHTVNKELEDRAAGKPRRVSFFLVSSRNHHVQLHFSVLDSLLHVHRLMQRETVAGYIKPITCLEIWANARTHSYRTGFAFAYSLSYSNN